MNIRYLIDELSHFQFCKISQTAISTYDIDLNQIKLFFNNETYFSESTLYIVKEPLQLPQTDHILSFIFLCKPNADIYPKEYNYIYLDVTTTPSDVIDSLINLFAEDQHLETALQPILDALLKDYGVQHITDAVSRLLENPFWIIDMNYNYITKPKQKLSDNKINQEIQLGYILEDTILFLQKNRTREHIQQLNDVVTFQAEGTDKHILMTAVKIKNITVAYINAFEENKSFSKFHIQLMNRIAEIVGMELQKTSYYKNSKGVMFSYFLIDLLENRMNAVQNIQKRMELLGYNMKKYFYMLVISLHNMEFREISLNTINEQIKYIVSNCIYCTYNNYSIFLITKSETAHQDSKLFSTLNQYLKDSNLIGGISGPFIDILKVKHHYSKALHAIELGKYFSPQNNLMKYSDLVIYHFIENSSQTIQFSELCAGAIEKLIQYDTENNTCLANTLRSYLNHNCHIAPSAKYINLHQNTLRYRLDKIRAIIGYSLENGEENLELFLALKILDYNYKIHN